ncbi:MAG: 6-O-methylguanine DNA methyltransferase [Deltaproteobacteria bacterium RBG_13_49_15]|nr:MAG: 6-O-methylguanine DNA methyltransferase [Deltaproteobacteria bacterium RBG_13_49_15]
MKNQADNEYLTDQARWNAVVRRDRSANKAFIYGVLTTSIYCRPACSSRLPKYENVRFFNTCEEAEQEGFRPCKRCRPKSDEPFETHFASIINICQLIENSEEPVPLKELGTRVGMSPFHFHRLFKKVIGITPKQYAIEKRLKRVCSELRKNSSVTDAIYGAGFASSSRFYEKVGSMLGMKPTEYKKGGSGIRIRFAVARTYLGWVLIGATQKGICSIDLGDHPEILKRRLRDRFPKAEILDNDNIFRTWVKQILAHIEKPNLPLNLPLDIQGTAFQRLIWSALSEIPPGSVSSYAEIAAKIGKPKAARAVARACASNQIALVIPCHRAVRRDGHLGGYRWDIERKHAALEREAKRIHELDQTESPGPSPVEEG